MVWPTGTVSNANVDQTTDSPATARSDLNSLITKVNDMITSRPQIKTLEPPGFPIGMGILTKFVWTSIGPTGSGATIIWDSLDLVPTDATGIIVSCVSHGGDKAICYIRKDGSTFGPWISQAVINFRVAPGQIQNVMCADKFVEISTARRVQIYIDYGTWDPLDNSFDLYLCGYYR